VDQPLVARYESCIACFRGDTSTAFAVVGEAEWAIAGLHALAGIPLDQAEATILVFAQQELGCDPGMVPAGVSTFTIRLCRDCARKTGVEVGSLDAGTIPGVRQPGVASESDDEP
jgi:hypothetical protein